MDYHDLRTPILNARFLQGLDVADREILADILTTILEDATVSTKDPADTDTAAIFFHRENGAIHATISPDGEYTQNDPSVESMLFSWDEFEGMAQNRTKCEKPLRNLLSADGIGKEGSA